MMCRKPFVKKGASFGCGQCLPCRLNRRRIWTHRMMLEALVHPRASFLTLTYKDMPHGGSLQPRDLTLFLKRLRKTVGPLRYFAVGEYGDTSWRPHYHAAIFGHGEEITDEVQKCWGLGYTLTGTLTVQSAQYIAGYVTKKMTSHDDTRLNGLYPEFARMSLRPGIGSLAVHDIAEALADKAKWDAASVDGDVPEMLRHAGRKLPLGRYLRGKLRDAMGVKPGDNMGRAFKKSAEVQAMYKDYLLDQSVNKAPFAIKVHEEVDQIIRNVESRFKIWNGVKQL